MEKVVLPRALSAKYKTDFAYPTIKDRLPVILVRAVDAVYRMKNDHQDEETREDIKSIVGRLSKLKNELQTDKGFLPLEDSRTDVKTWNSYLEEETKKQTSNGEQPSWFCSSWLYAECYFYRRIQEAIELSDNLKTLDSFRSNKEKAFISSLQAVKGLSVNLKTALHRPDNTLPNRTIFLQFLRVALWGNKCDLSISAGLENAQTKDLVSQLDSLNDNLLCDDSTAVWLYLEKQSQGDNWQGRLDFVIDNAGFEIFGDLCLAEYLLSTGIVKQVHWHAKAMSWFVSDVTRHDFDWTLDQLCQSDDVSLRELGEKWNTRLLEKSWVYHEDDFWTTPYDFSVMKSVAPELYRDLSQSDLILFKGDLNYRKLTGDLHWDSTTSFQDALRGFHPAPLCSLRTIKCDLVVGLQSGVTEKVEAIDKDWMLHGDFAVIQFCAKELR